MVDLKPLDMRLAERVTFNKETLTVAYDGKVIDGITKEKTFFKVEFTLTNNFGSKHYIQPLILVSEFVEETSEATEGPTNEEIKDSKSKFVSQEHGEHEDSSETSQ